ncbi:hypothetical protein M902_2925 [Bacteriovorax sp. BAL6_X]|uniref:hypothetical protein n=1 Tax=Bacteriovorax sp. BAL6_X TaxID=1201290 RepID=UPI000385C43E|nr:hypothetical protein [Bacteriovorax sp. BAL6_X]EPZ51105.1 hypothetical protein M902_2925 [Bacteriovorax sp. BAL6_X]
MSDGDNKNDLTRIEDLSEFLHQGDDELDKLLADLDESSEDSNEEDEAEIELAPFEYSNNSEENSDDDTYESEEEFYNDNNEDDSYDEAEYAFDESGPDDEHDQEEDQTDFNEDFESNFENNFEDDFDNNQDENVEYAKDDQIEDQIEDQENEEAEIALSPFEEETETEEDKNTFDEELPQQEEFSAPEIQAYEQVETPLTATPETVIPVEKAAQDFAEVRDFAANSTYGKVAIGGNPPFSILMQGIVPGEYDESILAILNEHGILGDNEDLYRTSLENGQLLIAQIGEFSAIYLAGKLRRYCRVIKLGLAHEIHASPNYDHNDQRGLTGPRSINQNKTKHFIRNDKDFNQEDILLSSSHFIPGYLITHSLGPMQINEVIDGNEFNDIKSINLIEYFSDLIKESAFKKGANAIISIHFTVNHHNRDSASNDIIIMAHGDYVVLEENKA